jgi:hypothetical protein
MIWICIPIARAAGSSSLSVNSFWAAEAGLLCCRLGSQSHIVPAASLIPIFFTTCTPCRSVISSFGLAALVFRLISSQHSRPNIGRTSMSQAELPRDLNAQPADEVTEKYWQLIRQNRAFCCALTAAIKSWGKLQRV